MSLFRKNKKIIDERVENIINKIYKEVYILIIIIAFLSIAVKYYVYGINYSPVTTELLILVLSSLYYIARTVQLGVYTDMIEVHDRTNKISIGYKNIIIGLLSGLAIAVYFGLRSAIVYGNDSNRIKYFILVFFASLMIYIPFFVAIIAGADAIARKASKQDHPED